jgi:hypothetical protein
MPGSHFPSAIQLRADTGRFVDHLLESRCQVLQLLPYLRTAPHSHGETSENSVITLMLSPRSS